MIELETTRSRQPPVEATRVRTDFSHEEVRLGVDEQILPGSLLLDRYEILSVLGQGGLGTVYLAEHVELGRKIAIKILAREWSRSSFVVRRFRAEARTAASIGHPNIIQMHDAGVFSDGRLFLVMEFVEGVELCEVLRDERPLAPLRACQIMLQVGLALEAVHALGVIHRDLKPGNIMLVPGADGEELVKVLDFGIAANLAATGLQGEQVARSGHVMGTPEYMAPEQATGDVPSPAFDIYAMGVILFEMLTGALPLTAEHSFELLAFKRHYPAPSLGERAPALPAGLIELVDECLRIDPELRPPTVTAVVGRLRAVIAELRGELPPSARTSPVSPSASASASAAASMSMSMSMSALAGRRVPWARLGLLGVGALALSLAVFGRSASLPLQRSIVEEDSAPTSPPPRPGEGALVMTVETGADDAAQPTPTGAPSTLGKEPAGAPTGRAGKSRLVRGESAVRLSQAHTTERCSRVRKAATEARQTHAWALLRTHSRNDECWEAPAEARKLQVKAMLELGDYAGCAAAGADSRDPEVVAWVKLCGVRGGA